MTSDIKRLAWIVVVCCLIVVMPSYANTPEKQEETSIKRSVKGQAYYEQIQEVLAQQAFGEKKKVKRWRLKEQKDDKEQENAFLRWLNDFLKGLKGRDQKSDGSLSIAKGIEVVLWALVIGLILYLLIKYRTQIQAFVTGIGVVPDSPELPSTMFGLDVKKTSMPDDVVGSAKAFWQSGEQRQAIALLLRGSLIKLIHEHQCFFQDSDTEAECCARIEQHVPQALSQYMHLLVQVWQQLAYGHSVPSQAVFDSLCRQWQEVF